jgi:hypothetical protein
VSSALIIERHRVREWIADHRLGGGAGSIFAFHGNCSTPVELYARGLPDKLLVVLGMEAETPSVGTLRVRCRKCEECLRHRARLWAARARNEIDLSERSWFGTLTLSPENALRTQFAMETAATRQGWCLQELSKSDQFKKLVEQVSPEVTKFLKRIRRASGARLRYLCVAEPHDSAKTSDERRGVPHWHLLIHENLGRVTERQLSCGWRYGWSQFRLVDRADSRTPFYLTKYLTKSETAARLRASIDYGRAPARTLAERLESATRTIQQTWIGRPPTDKSEGTLNDETNERLFSSFRDSYTSEFTK